MQLISHWEQYGFGVWLLVNRNTGELLGHCGLRKIDETGEIEIMYLLDPNIGEMDMRQKQQRLPFNMQKR